MRFVDEQNDRFRGGRHLINNLPQSIFEFAFHARARLEQAEIKRAQHHIFERRWHITGSNAQSEPFDNRGFSDACLARQNRIILPAPHEDVDDLSGLLVTTDNWINLAFARFLGEIGGKSVERFLLAHRSRSHRATGFPRRNTTADLTGLRCKRILRGSGDTRRESIRKFLDVDFREVR